MKLALIDPAALSGSRTESLQFLQLADALARTGAQVNLITPTTGILPDLASIIGRDASPRLNVISLCDRRGSLPYRLLGLSRSNKPVLRELARWIDGGGLDGTDVIYVRNLKVAEALLARVDGLPIFFHAHEHFARVFEESHDLRKWWQQRKLDQLKRRERQVYRSVAGIIATVSAIVEDIRADYGAEIEACVVPNGVDLDLALAARTQAAVRQGTRPRALYLGSLHPWKGVETVVHALVHSQHRVELLVAGGEARRILELQSLAEKLGVADDVRFLGPVDPARRFELIRDVDLALLPLTARSGMASRYTSPLKLFEYLAMGKAILASDLPSVRSVVTNGIDVLLSLADTPEDWAANMLKLVDDAVLRQQLGEAASRKGQQCGWTARAESILSWINQRITIQGWP